MKRDQYARDFLRPRIERGAQSSDLEDFYDTRIDFEHLAARAALGTPHSQASPWFWAFIFFGAVMLAGAFVSLREKSENRDIERPVNVTHRDSSTSSRTPTPAPAPLPNRTDPPAITRGPIPSSPPNNRPTPRPTLPTPPHVERTAEGKWRPEFGYTWVDPNSDGLEVRWVPGVPHPRLANVVSSKEPGKLAAAPGYRFRSTAPDDFTVVAIRTEPTEEAKAAAVGKIMIALFSQGVMEMESDPDAGDFEIFFDGVGRAFARELRDEAIRSALTDVFPGSKPAILDAAANFILLAADGQLSAGQLFEATTHDALIRRLREMDPEAADAEFMAEFLLRVARECDSRR